MTTTQKSPAGFVAGRYKTISPSKNSRYQCFFPNPINRRYHWADPKIPVLLEDARGALGELNAYSALIPDVDFFIERHVMNEAVKSSQLEGTKTDIQEAALPQHEVVPEKRDDWQEVQNYVEAINHAIVRLPDLPICMRLLNEAHERLMFGVRGQHKQPGEIRKMQNWIGGANLQTAHFIPPHQNYLAELLTDFEMFLHNRDLNMPHLIKAAMVHYQFETLHPYNDGNGRIGRMLIILQLIELEVLAKPTLYLSDFFERRKSEYYDALTWVRTRNDMDQWIAFFLVAVTETAKKSKGAFEKIIELRESCEQRAIEMHNAKNARKLLRRLFSKPFTTVQQAAKQLNVSMSTANSLVNEMSKAKMLREITGHSRNRIFVFTEYLNIFRD